MFLYLVKRNRMKSPGIWSRRMDYDFDLDFDLKSGLSFCCPKSCSWPTCGKYQACFIFMARPETSPKWSSSQGVRTERTHEVLLIQPLSLIPFEPFECLSQFQTSFQARKRRWTLPRRFQRVGLGWKNQMKQKPNKNPISWIFANKNPIKSCQVRACIAPPIRGASSACACACGAEWRWEAGLCSDRTRPKFPGEVLGIDRCGAFMSFPYHLVFGKSYENGWFRDTPWLIGNLHILKSLVFSRAEILAHHYDKNWWYMDDMEVSEVMGVTPHHPVVMDDHSSTETHRDWGSTILRNPHLGRVGKALRTMRTIIVWLYANHSQNCWVYHVNQID